MDAKELREYRNKLYTDLHSNTIPDRVPVQDGIGIEFVIQYAGKDLLRTEYDYSAELLTEVYDKAINEVMRGDKLGAGFARNAVSMLFTGNLQNQVSETGMIQHPEKSFMSADEYDEFIKNPYDFTIDVLSPRMNKEFAKGPAYRSRAVLLQQMANADQNAMFAQATGVLGERYGFATTPPGSSGIGQPPFDHIADFCRGFSQIPMDMRRCPDKLHAAMDAVMPLMIARSIPQRPHILGAMMVMTHMAAFLSNKQYDEFYGPQLNELVHINAEYGACTSLFLEGDWTRFIDEISEMPMGTRFYMEYGDMRKFKDALGKNFVLGGFYPLVLLRTGTKEQCIDKAKELLDIMAPGGNYYFCFDKSALNPEDINVENYTAVMEYVRDNTKYANAGEKISQTDRESTIIKGLRAKYPDIPSKYLLSYDEYKKEYPPVTEDVEPLIRKMYDKYMARMAFNTNC